MTSETVLKVIDEFKENRTRFIEFCRSLSDEELGRPVPDSTYTVKDFASHLGTLDPAMTKQIEALAAGRVEEIGANPDGTRFDIDKFNDGLVAARRDWTLDAILDEAAQNREEFLKALAKLEDEQIELTMHFTGDNKRPAADVQFKLFLKGLTRHDPIHVADMMKALPERAEDAAIQEWINDTLVRWYQKAMAGPATR